MKELALYTPGPDQGRQLALQSRHARRSLQRPDHRPPGRASRRRLLQHQAHQHGSPCLVCANAGNSLQRKSCAFEPGMSEPRARATSGLHAWRVRNTCSQDSATSFTPACNRPSARTCHQRRLHLEVHSQRIRLQRPRQYADLRFPSTGTTRRFPALRCVRMCRNSHNISAFVVMSSVAARFFPPQVAGAGATVGQSGFPFRIDHDEKVQPDHPRSVPGAWRTWPVGRLQLAV